MEKRFFRRPDGASVALVLPRREDSLARVHKALQSFGGLCQSIHFEEAGKDRDRLESAGDDFHERVRGGYREIAGRDGWIVIDGSDAPDAVEAAVWEAVSGRLGW